MHERVTIIRDCHAVTIPNGEPVVLTAGTMVTVTQSLGGAYTLITDRGAMVRLSGTEVDAIGKVQAEAAVVEGEVNAENLEKSVWDQLRTCYDPEIPVNIVDLGLVYLCSVEPQDDGYRVDVKMTLTAPGCGMGPVLAADVEGKVRTLPGVKDAKIDVVFDPVWDRSMMSEAAKLQLGMMW